MDRLKRRKKLKVLRVLRSEYDACQLCGDTARKGTMFCYRCDEKIEAGKIDYAQFSRSFARFMTGRTAGADHLPKSVLRELRRRINKRERKKDNTFYLYPKPILHREVGDCVHTGYARRKRASGEKPGAPPASDWTSSGRYEASGTCDYPAVRHKAA